MKCIICGSENLQKEDTIISDFVMARIDPSFDSSRVNRKIKLCFCKDCTFSFYDYRLSQKENDLLYKNYRDDEYQRTRQKYECWYTPKVNAAINAGGVSRQQSSIKESLEHYGTLELKSALDYGGNEGATFYDDIGTEHKYVYDVSGVKPLPGIIGISDYSELKKHRYDFIMCNMVFEHLPDPLEVAERLYELGDDKTIYYIEVPSENPFTKGNKFSITKNLSLAFNSTYSFPLLVKYYFKQRKQPFMPMKEHINFFTVASMRIMLEKVGFIVDNVLEKQFENGTVLSVVFRKTGKQG